MTAAAMGPALALAALAGAAASCGGLRRSAVAGLAAVVFAGSLIPWGATSVAGYVLAFPGPLSAATLVLIVQLLLRTLAAPGAPRPSSTLLGCVIVSGLLLYPASTGLVALDVYDLGFHGRPFQF